MRKYRRLHPEEDRERKRVWFLKNKGRIVFQRKRSRIKRKYNLSLEDLEKMKNLQNNKCLICGGSYELNIDHDHKTNIVRGLLCDLCNRGLGYFKDSPDLLKNAAQYLIERGK